MIKVGILTISDKGWQGKRRDKSGEVLKGYFSSPESSVVKYTVVPDEAEIIADKLSGWADEGSVDIILTT